MCTTEQTFAWVGAIVVNIAFISIIAWGASTNWPLGFLISIVYTAILFGLAMTVDKKSGWDVVTAGGDISTNNINGEGNDHNNIINEAEQHLDGSAEQHNETENVVVVALAAANLPLHSRIPGSRSFTMSHPEPRMPVLANLLYGLFSIALGVTGYFLPMNLFRCYGGPNGPYVPAPGHWSTDISKLPSDNVQKWASSADSQPMHSATFVHFSSIGGEQNTTLFQGSDVDGHHPQSLWSTTMGGEPINFPNIQYPSQFVKTGTGWACFSGVDPTPYSNGNSKGGLVGCSNGTTVRTTTDSTEYSLQSPHAFLIDNNTLWFMDYPPWSGDQTGSGTLIYSLDNYDDMQVVLHSTYTQSESERDDDEHSPDEIATNDIQNCWMKHAALAIAVSAIPVTLASILLWHKRKAPSSAITSYVGISACAFFLFLIIVDSESNVDTFWKWWLSVSGALYLIIVCDLTHCKRRIARCPLIWGINFSAVAFFVGMILLTGIFESSLAWTWIVFNVVALIPLVVVGIGYNQVFLLVLYAIGWLMTAVKIASAIAAVAASPAANVPIYFVVLAISGLLIAGAGWWLNKNQDELGSVLCYHMERLSLSRRMFSDDVELEETATGGDELHGEESA